MTLTAAQCRQFADQCIEIAEKAQLEHIATLHNVAEGWLRLAEELLKEQLVAGDSQNAPSTEKMQ